MIKIDLSNDAIPRSMALVHSKSERKMNFRTMEIIKNIVFIPLFILLILVTLLMVSQKIPIGGYSSYVVLSGSMSPTFNAGDMIVSQKTNTSSIAENDIVVFNDPSVTGKIITHRAVKIENKNNQRVITTKGDANNSADQWSLPMTSVLGKTVFSIPLIGYLVVFARQPAGFFLLVLLPGMVIIISELISLGRYVKSLEVKMKEYDKVQS